MAALQTRPIQDAIPTLSLQPLWLMATIREKRPGVWEVRQYVGRDARGRPRQISQIVRGSRRDAERAASELAVRPRTYEGATTTLGELLHLWVEASLPTWAPSSAENQRSRARLVQADPIASIAVARLTPVDVDRWHARMAMQGLGASAARNRHSVVRAALSLALRWGWVPSNPAAAAPLRRRRPSSRDALQTAEVRAVLDSAELLVAGGHWNRTRVWGSGSLPSRALVAASSLRCAGMSSRDRG